MKSNFKAKKMIWIMLAVVAISLVLTAMIVGSITAKTNARIEKFWFFQKSIESGQPFTIKNAYLISCKDGQLSFLYGGELYEVDGRLETDVTGVTDIEVKGDDIVKIYAKPNSVKGVLDSYDATSMCLNIESEKKEVPRFDDIPVYKVSGSKIIQADWNQFIVGVSKIKCIMEKGKACAILIEEDVLPSDIRVVIKNNSDVFHENLYIKKVSDDSLLNVNEMFEQETGDSLRITDAKGLRLCNSQGESAKEPYLGEFRVIKTEKGLVLVNELGIEEYLKYVVPSEMPLSFGLEALKAQAVCARTYAYSQLYNQTYANYGANIDDTTSFQVYHNSNRQNETDRAVTETAGEVITRNGALITSQYYSTHPKDEGAPFSGWRAYLDMDAAKHEDYGALMEIEILSKNKEGYAAEVKFSYEEGAEILENEYKIRMKIAGFLQEVVLSDESVRTNFPILPSAYFEVKETADGEIYLEGGGYGHGNGMSQYGAKIRAEKGYDYKEIIQYYYENVVVKPLF